MRKILFVIASAFLFVSCGGSGSKKAGDVIIEPVSEKVEGPVGEYFEVVKKDYKVEKNQYDNYEVFVEFKRIAEGLPEPWTKGMEIGSRDGQFKVKFTYEFLDADGNVIAEDSNSAKKMRAICALPVGESTSILVTVTDSAVVHATQFKVGSKAKYKVPKSEKNSVSESDTESESEED